MNLSITLFDHSANPLPNAQLVIVYQMPNGKHWKSGVLSANAKGVVNFEMDPKVFAQVKFRDAKYYVVFKTKKYEATVSRLPTKAAPLLHLNAKGLATAVRDETDKPTPREKLPTGQILLQLTFKTDDGKLLRNAPLVVSATLNGKITNTEIGKTNNRGALEYSTTMMALLALTQAKPKVINKATGKEFDIVKVDREKADAETLTQIWTLRPTSAEIEDRGEEEIKPPTDTPRPEGPMGEVLGRLIIDGEPVTGRKFSLVWYRPNGLRMDISLPKTDKGGWFLWEGTIIMAVEAAMSRAQLYDDKSLKIYKVERTEDANVEERRATFVWHIAETDEEIEERPELEDGEQGLVSGTITASGGQPQARMIVRAFDVDFPDEEELGTAETDDGGFYAINYAAGTAKQREKDALDIVVRVYEPGSDAKAVPLAESELAPKAPIRLRVDLVSGKTVYPGASLYERIYSEVEPTLKGASIRALTPASVALLVVRTRFSKQELGRFVIAWGLALLARQSETDRNAAAPFFGWLTDGMPAHPVALALQPPEKLSASLRRAIDANWIPSVDIKDLLDTISSARAEIIAEHQPDLIAYMRAGGLSDNQAQKVIGVFLDGLDAVARNAEILSQLGKSKGERALELIEIWRALGGNTRLGTKLLEDGNVQVPRDLVELSIPDLATHARQSASVPDHVDGKTDNARARTYATTLAEQIEDRYPIAFFAHQLTLMQHPETRRLGNRLKTSLEMQPVRAGAANPVIIDGWDQELVDLGSLYAAAVPARRAPLVDQLIQHAYKKAPDITEKGRTNFREKMSGKFARVGEAADADAVFNRAQMIVSMANAVKMQQITEQLPGDGVPRTLSRQLFQGSINGTCPHCKSMTGPSAYLLDLVRYVGRANAGDNKTGWDRIDARRPDLKNIDLTCANSDTPMPYIDLVLELLEDQIAPWTDGPRQTVTDEATLAERPYYVNHSAYNQLKERKFPWAAYYDRSFDLTRRSLAQAGLSLPDLLDATASGGTAQRIGLWKDGLFALEKNGAKAASAMGVGNLNGLKRFKSLPALAKHLLIDPQELLGILQSFFVNPEAKHLVDQNGVLDWTSMGAGLVGRLAFLGQMRVHTGLSLAELDAWLAVADPAKEGWQEQMAAGLRLAASHRLTPSDIGMIISLPNDARMAELADIAGVSEALMTHIDTVTDVASNTATGLDNRLWLATMLADGGRRNADMLLALIDVPTPDGPFSPDIAAETAQTLATTYAAAFPDATEDVTAEEVLLVAETLASGVSAQAATFQALLPATSLIEKLRAGEAIATPVMRLWKQARAVELLDLDSEDIHALPALTSRFGLLDLATLPTSEETRGDLVALATLVALADFNARFYRGGESLFQRLTQTTAQLPSLRTALALPDLDATALAPLLGASGLGLKKTSDLFTPRRLADLATLITGCRQLSTDGATLLDTITKTKGNAAWDLTKTAAPPSAWPRMARQISDPIRERARDALLATLIHRSASGNGPTFETADDVYGQFLIDPQMMSVVDTSRIKQASASIQQFVQRVQLGLEPGVVFAQNDASQWVWRRNYRVWEANRKVIVFPENWIRPELRDNKTDLYKQLESDLLKSDIRAETAEDALLAYARGLHEVAGLEMVALQKDDETGTTYVVGRTREKPHSYFFNSRGLNGLWSGWEAIDIELEGNHIIPVVYARRIFLAWVTFENKIAVDDPAYLEKISILESEQSVVRDEIDATKRKITEIENKQEENAKYLEETWGGPNGSILARVYDQINDAYTNLLVELRGDNAGEEGGQLGDLRTRERELISEVNKLKLQYTYYEASLSISQRRRNGGWEPVRKSSSTIRSILEAGGFAGVLSESNTGDKTVFYSNLDQFHVRVGLDGQDLTFTVCYSYDKHNDNDERSEMVFGTFNLDIVNNILTATERHSLNNRFKSAILRNGHVDGQTITLRPGEETLTVLDQGHVPLLGNVSNSKARAVPHRYADGTSMVFEQGHRSYLLEKQRFGQRAHAAVDLQGSGRPAPIADASVAVTEADVDLPVVSLAGDEGWRFTPLYHPFSDVVVTELYRYGLDGLYLPDAASGQQNANMLTRQQVKRENFAQLFSPTEQVAAPLPVENFSFNRTNPYGVYNWELFFHAPFAIAEALRQNRRFEDARRWYHFIFNPLDKDGPSLAAVWRFGPFHREHIRILKGDTPDLMDDATNPDFAAEVEEWEQNPFNPHAVARTRTVAYMRTVYIAYLENLIDWGDDLFRRDTMEAVNEAAQLYVFALDMLGNRPVELPEIEDGTPPKSVAEALSWTPSIERILAAAGKVQPHPDNQTAGSAFFELFGDFCMPSNDKLTGLWARLADRLFKIRNSLNIDGTFRKLALFQPPIDPALLVKAAASGLSIADAVAGLSARRPNYRFTFMVAKALEFTADVRGLGASLLSAIEKRDAETLSNLRASHEVAMNQRMRAVYQDRIKEAEYSIASLDAELARLTQEELHYDALIQNGNLQEETTEDDLLKQANNQSSHASGIESLAALAAVVPQFGMNGAMPTWSFGGSNVSSALRALGSVFAFTAQQNTHHAVMTGRTAGRIRRAQDWLRAKENAAASIKRVQQDRLAAEIRLAIAEKDLEQHDLRIEQARETETFLKDKFTNEALYSWMIDRLSGLYFQAFKLASDLAGQAQVCYRDELSDDTASFLEPGAWDSLHKGLLAGEQLTLDLRRMEASYLARNTRQHELTKSISLAQLNPAELLRLRETGSCQLVLPEALYDLDHAGHINRRIKSVNVTIPALAGPQTSISATLSLASSEVRRKGADGDTALHPSRAGESLATSTGQNDTGMFQFDFRDPRYLKFEGAGAISTWDIDLPDPALAQFDYGSISDLILQIHYTAEDGPENHATAVKNALRAALSDVGLPGRTLFSLRYDFPETWARLKNTPDLTTVALDFSTMQFPYLYANRQIDLTHLTFTAVVADQQDAASSDMAISASKSDTVEMALSADLRDALDGSARDILLIVEFTAGGA